MNKILDNTQKMLDRLKWLESEKQGVDMSGCMLFCKHCEKCLLNSKCEATQEEREKYCLCAKAYKRYMAKQREKKWLTR